VQWLGLSGCRGCNSEWVQKSSDGCDGWVLAVTESEFWIGCIRFGLSRHSRCARQSAVEAQQNAFVLMGGMQTAKTVGQPRELIVRYNTCARWLCCGV